MSVGRKGENHAFRQKSGHERSLGDVGVVGSCRCSKVSTCFPWMGSILTHMTLRVLDSLPNLLGPVIQIIGEAVGMHISLLIGSPEPQKKGQLNMVGYVSFLSFIPRC